MAYVLTNKQMREADEYTIKTLGVDSFSLMGRAGQALANASEKIAPKGRIIVLCGGGNNGGDGFVCAKILKEHGRELCVVLLSETLSNECQKAKLDFEQIGGKIEKTCDEKQTYALVIDCMFGTGFHGEFQGEYLLAAKAIENWKNQGAKVLSADIPSGVNGDNGFACEHAVCATHTLCIGERKAGVYLHEGIDHSGEIFRENIGISLPENSYAHLLDLPSVKQLLKKRKRNVHKGTFGKAAIVGGSEEYMGAAALSLSACLRSGVGYTTLFTPKNLLPYFYLKYPEALLKSLNDGGGVAFTEENFQTLLPYDAIAYGMGMGISEDTAQGAKWLLTHYHGKLILDADGLNSLAQFERGNFTSIFQKKTCDVVLTPHVKEFSRLSGESVEEILKGGFASPVRFAGEHNICVLLKNAVSMITDGKETFLNVNGNSGQAKGGSGDVLSGVIAGLCASGISALDAAKIGAYLTGLSAEIVAKEKGEYSMLPSDVVATLGRAFLQITEDFYKESEQE